VTTRPPAGQAAAQLACRSASRASAKLCVFEGIRRAAGLAAAQVVCLEGADPTLQLELCGVPERYARRSRSELEPSPVLAPAAQLARTVYDAPPAAELNSLMQSSNSGRCLQRLLHSVD
jgi:hypothetical protein